MKHITVRDIERATKGTLICMNEEEEEGDVAERQVTDLCINSQKIKAGDLFVPLLGENTDGHNYLPSAMEKAAAALTAKAPEELYGRERGASGNEE